MLATVIPDNIQAIVERADATEPRLTQAFVEYAQSRGFLVEPVRVRSTLDKPRYDSVWTFGGVDLTTRGVAFTPRKT